MESTQHSTWSRINSYSISTHLHLIIIKAQFCLLGGTPLLDGNTGTLTPGKGPDAWDGESTLGGGGVHSWAASLDQSIPQGDFVRSAFQTTKCIPNISITLYVFPIL